MKKEKTIEKKIQEIDQILQNPDVNQRSFFINQIKVTYYYIESLCSDDKIGEYLLKSISKDTRESIQISVFEHLLNTLPNAKTKVINSLDQEILHLQNGFTLIFIEGESKTIALETKATLDRGVNVSTNENVIRGPKDSFTENYMTNLGLVRKRIKDEQLKIKEHIVGRRTKSKVSLLYIHDLANLENVEKIEKKLKQIDIDGILDSGYIRDFLIKKNRFFPTVISTERPDMVSYALLEGKMVIMVENSPIAIIMPGLFMDFFTTTEDAFQMANNISLTKIIRYLSFFVTLLTPAIFIALTAHHQSWLPSQLQKSILEQRANLSMPLWVETIILIFIFEIIRESNVRTPSVLGSSMSIVGGLVLGDAAVTAEIASAIGVIIVAITSISGLIFSDIDMINSIRLWRILLIFLATLFGIYGVIFGILFFLYELSRIKVLGIPYLVPIFPFYGESLKHLLFRSPHDKLDDREPFLTKNIKRKK